jgi:hypothetical protein
MEALLTPAGVLVLAVASADIFLTVLYPASGRGPLRRPLTWLVWRAFKLPASRLPPDRQRRLLGYCGPTLVAVSIAAWPLLLVLGWALVYYPALGSGVVASSGPTSQDWPTAVYFSGFALTTLGTGDVVPVTGLYRILTVVEAGVGFAVVSMVVSYFLTLYSAITQRKTFAAELDHRTQRTGDGARLVAGLAAQGGVSAVLSQLASTGSYMERLSETHRSYPVLRYFHYREARYSLPRVLLITLDAAALVGTALADLPGPPDGEPPALALVHGAARDLLGELAPRASAAPGEEDEWRRRFAVAVEQFRAAGLQVRDDPGAADEYVRWRREWDGPLSALTSAMLYDRGQIEPFRAGTTCGPSRP